MSVGLTKLSQEEESLKEKSLEDRSFVELSGSLILLGRARLSVCSQWLLGVFGPFLGTVLLLTMGSVSAQTTYYVTNGSGTGEGTLPYVIQEAAQSGNNNSVISISNGLTITMVNQQFISVSSLNIEGNGATINMGANPNVQDRAFFIAGGNVTISNLTIEGGRAVGGYGQDGGGGGAGLGGAIFVASGENIPGSGITNVATTVLLSNITFTNNEAMGGNGGVQDAQGEGGGGGMGGQGGNGFGGGSGSAAGGGGFGIDAFGGNSTPEGGSANNGSSGAFVGGASGGGGNSDSQDNDGSGGADGGGGGNSLHNFSAQSAGGGGGVGGGYAHNQDGGQGGFGGGGGGGANAANGGNGGFGGGGGSTESDGGDANPGNGGFGGGGGGQNSSGGSTGEGGFGGGQGGGNGDNNASGGGGLGAGGAIFVTAGASLIISGSSFSGDSVSAGAGSGNGSTGGSALGAGMFLGGTTTFSNNGTMTMSEVMYGTSQSTGTTLVTNAGIISEGSGTLILTGNNSYQGGTTIDSGSTVQIGNGGTSGQLGSGGATVNGTLAYDLSGNFTENNSLSGGGVIQQNGSGTLILNGGTNFTGAVTINNGTLLVGPDRSTFSTGQLPSTSGNVTINSGGTLLFTNTSSTSYTFSNPFIGGSGTLLEEDTNTLFTFIGPLSGTLNITVNVNQTNQFGNGGTVSSLAGGLISISGQVTYDLSGTTIASNTFGAYGGLVQEGSGTLILTGNSGFQGHTDVNSGSTLQFGNGGTTGQLISSNTGGNWPLDNSGTVIFDRSGIATNYNAISGGGTLEQIGSGTLVLLGPNTYTSGFIIGTNSTLQVGNGGILGQLGSGGVVNDGTLTYDLNVQHVGQFTLFTSYTESNDISGTGGLHQMGTGTVFLGGSNTFSGGVSVDKGSGGFAVANSYALADATITNWTGITIEAGVTNIVLGGVSGSNSVALTNQSGASVSLTVGSGDDPLYSGSLAGTGVSLNKIGSAALILTGSNTYGGGTTIATNSILQVGNGGTSGQLGSGGVQVNGTLIYDRADTLQEGNAISGSGTVQQSGSGTLILATNSSFTGAMTVSSGTLKLASNASIAPVTTIANSGAEILNNGTILGTTTINGTLAGNGGKFSTLQLDGGSDLVWNISSLTGTVGAGWDSLSAGNLSLNVSPTNPLTITVDGSSGSGNGSTNYVFNLLSSTSGPIVFDTNGPTISSNDTELGGGENEGASPLGINTNDFTINTSNFTPSADMSDGVWSIGINNLYNGGQALTLNYDVLAVPEPSPTLLLGAGALLLVVLFRRRISKKI